MTLKLIYDRECKKKKKEKSQTRLSYSVKSSRNSVVREMPEYILFS